MVLFVLGDLRVMLQCQSNVIQPIQKAVSYKFVNREFGKESLIIAYLAFFEIDRDFVVVDVLRPLHHRNNFIIRQKDGQESVLGRVVGEDVSE